METETPSLFATVSAFVQTNWPVLVAVLAGLLGVAKLIVKLTPSTKDDAVVETVENTLEKVGVLKDNDPEK